MLRPFIIEEMRRRDDEQRRRSERHPLRVELPRPDALEPPRGDKRETEEQEQGIVIVDFSI